MPSKRLLRFQFVLKFQWLNEDRLNHYYVVPNHYKCIDIPVHKKCRLPSFSHIYQLVYGKFGSFSTSSVKLFSKLNKKSFEQVCSIEMGGKKSFIGRRKLQNQQSWSNLEPQVVVVVVVVNFMFDGIDQTCPTLMSKSLVGLGKRKPVVAVVVLLLLLWRW